MQLYYFFDPMCSWCWGFAPQLERLRHQYAERLPLTLVVGGLRSETHPLDEAQRDYIKGHWHRVQEASGQPFDFEHGLPTGFVYDTEPACRAVVTAREMGSARLFDFIESMQRAFYAEARDITDPAVVAQLAVDAGMDRARFAEALVSDSMRSRTKADFELCARLGVQGFPTLALKHDQQWSAVSQGFLPWASLQARLEAVLAG
ncbi:DsbA family protein [Aestuariirhabdus litorea]|uniref:DsbA family protein n=1 Tax=Aestuariirhabdus litorea TaxID=2528527 RepID=A0A3P3VRR8_9GAMM|nr:DsbA family protein [Aestuariirhabdus litorea]RRJ84209.1 DsbA family protein [Aestuariirhabdus litorea]RWW97431.1 DsbA family protein [Endozoicomonadaceae bacterium GTF-13]